MLKCKKNSIIKKIDYYVISSVCISSLVVLFALLSIESLSKIMLELEDVGEKNYTLWVMFTYVFSMVPLKLILFFPMALLIGALLGLGKLASGNELTVMQISGVSRLRLGIIGFLLSVVLGGLVLAVTEFVGVAANDWAIKTKAKAMERVIQTYSEGVWAQDGNHFVSVAGVRSDGMMSGIKIYTVDKDMQISAVIKADRAAFRLGDWRLFDVLEKRIGKMQIVEKQYAEMQWKNALSRDVITLLLTDPEELSMRDLYRYIQYQEANEIKPTNYLLVFWQRLFVPLSTGVMFLLSLPFVFGTQRNHTQGRRLFLGVLFGLGYFVFYTSIANLILLTGAPVVLGAVLPIVVFACLSFFLLWLRA